MLRVSEKKYIAEYFVIHYYVDNWSNYQIMGLYIKTGVILIMNELEKVISKMDFQYFGTGQHKIDVETFLQGDNILLLDVRAKEEIETIKIGLAHHCPVLEIPTNEVPARLNEIPKDKKIGVFCSSGVRCVIIFAYLKSKGYENVKVLPKGYESLTPALLPGKIFKKINN